MPVKSAIRELSTLEKRNTASVQRAILDVARATLTGSSRQQQDARDALAKLIAQTMTLADLIGRKRVLLEVYGKSNPKLEPAPVAAFADEISPVVPHVPFEEAIEDIIGRTAIKAQTAEAVARVYQDQHGFALAKLADLRITRRIQTALAGMMEAGVTQPTAEQVLTELGNFPRAYAETVYRTNLNTAFQAGRMQQALDPDVADLVPAFEYQAVLDSDVRPNHKAADGFVALTTDPIWELMTPPNGYNCRCTLRMMDADEFAARYPRGITPGRIRFTGDMMPDVNFTDGRTDRTVYGGGSLI